MMQCKRPWRETGLVVLLAVMLPLLLMRISIESSLWCDEIYSIVMAGMPASDVIDQTALDYHPPGYYLALKGWLALGRSIGLTPGVFWGRLPGVIGWLGLVAAAWFLGRKEFGRPAAMLLTWSVAIAAQTANVVKDMRPYALAYPAVFICFMLLLGMRSRNKQALGWILYSVCASVALWSQMLTGPVLGLLAIMWLVTGLGLHGVRRKKFLIEGFIAQAAGLISFLPWVPLLASTTIGHLEDHRSWMTPPTVKNWLWVFGLWYPLGRRGGEAVWGFKVGWQATVGLMTLAVPLAGLAWSRFRQNTRRIPRIWKGLAVWGIALALVNVTLLWALDRSGTVVVFHGPRYTAFTAALWMCGLVGLSQCVRIKAGWRPWTSWILMAPWLIVSIVGQAMDLSVEMNRGLIAVAQKGVNPMPSDGEPVYVIPSELIPFQKRTLARWDARPIEDIAGILQGTDHSSILIFNNWLTLTSERDMIVQAMLKSGRLAQSVTPQFMPPNPGDLEYFTLLDARGWNHEAARELGRVGFRTKAPAIPSGAIARIDAGILRMRDGWHIIQADADLQRYRWSSAAWTRVFLPPLEPGRYKLHLSGARWPMFAGPTRLWIQPPGPAPLAMAEIGAGSFEIAIPVDIAKPEPRPVVRLNHTVMNVGQPGAEWWVGIAFYGLWLERAL